MRPEKGQQHKKGLSQWMDLGQEFFIIFFVKAIFKKFLFLREKNNPLSSSDVHLIIMIHSLSVKNLDGKIVIMMLSKKRCATLYLAIHDFDIYYGRQKIVSNALQPKDNNQKPYHQKHHRMIMCKKKKRTWCPRIFTDDKFSRWPSCHINVTLWYEHLLWNKWWDTRTLKSREPLKREK